MPNKKYTVAVLGAGNMGTAMAKVIGDNGHTVKLWNHESDPEPLEQIKSYHENKKYLPNVTLPKTIVPEPDLAKAVKGVDAVFFVIPSNFMATIAKRVGPLLTAKTICVDTSKGLGDATMELIPDIIKKNLPPTLRPYVVSVSGPAIAVDMARGGFTAMNIAGKNSVATTIVKKIMEGKNVKLFPTTDLVGVEIGGSFKNVYAIAMGICDGLKFPMNTKAALLVVALKEIGSLVKKMGGKTETAFDLAGLGDLIGTSLSPVSRNRRFGECLAEGLCQADALAKVNQVVEGINAVKIMLALGKKFKIRLPLAETVYGIVWKEQNPAIRLNKFLQSL
jgi:glycerol-3-phosphate dehydrogenase (NAD(P)+)